MILHALMAAASVFVGANELAEGVAEPGWPILISALFEAGTDSSRAVPPKELTVRLLDSSGRVVPMLLQAASPVRGEGGWRCCTQSSTFAAMR